ncbi:hypothetical protein OQA88_4805 [Cercophora sp. LCS_1]
MPEFQLSAQLKGHDSDVRTVLFPAPDVILSGGRDKTARVWRKTTQKPPTFDDKIVSNSEGFVNSLAFVRRQNVPGSHGLLVQGGADAMIEVKNPASPNDETKRLLFGHSNNVCTLDVFPNGNQLVSGSWDGSAMVWDLNKWEQIRTLKHVSTNGGSSVWAVLAYTDELVITGSADGNVRIFSLRDAGGHEILPKKTLKTGDVVRALCKLPADLKSRHPTGADFASAGNDSTIQLWKITGEQVGTLHGHASFIYSLAALPTGEIVSSGEDRTLRIWRGTNCVQTITHPAISVWSVAVCSVNGDIVSGASDKMIRVFTRNVDRIAAPDVISEYEQSLQLAEIPKNQVSESDKTETVTKEWLQSNQGKKDGQLALVKEDNGSILAYQWATGRGWIQIGTVVDPPSQRPKVQYKGKEYDYVFDVDVEEGKPTLKLPYNLTEDTYQAATRFLGDNNLPITYIEAVANFIRENTKDAVPATSTTVEDKPPPTTTASVATYLPHVEYLAITQGTLGPALKKINEWNAQHIAEGNKHIALNPGNLKSLQALVQAYSTGNPAAGTLQEAIPILLRLATNWPYAHRLPILDIIRCVVANPAFSSHINSQSASPINLTLRGALDVNDPVGLVSADLVDFVSNNADWPKVNPRNVMLALRAVTNLFLTPEGRNLATKEADAILAVLGRVAGVGEKQGPFGSTNDNFYHNMIIALISAAFNFACLAYNERRQTPPTEAIDLGRLAQVFGVAEAVIRNSDNGEVQFRAAMTAGMLLASNEDAKEIAKTLDVQVWLQAASRQTSDERVKAVVAECANYLG